jgi:hypothetical protein
MRRATFKEVFERLFGVSSTRAPHLLLRPRMVLMEKFSELLANSPGHLPVPSLRTACAQQVLGGLA